VRLREKIYLRGRAALREASRRAAARPSRGSFAKRCGQMLPGDACPYISAWIRPARFDGLRRLYPLRRAFVILGGGHANGNTSIPASMPGHRLRPTSTERSLNNFRQAIRQRPHRPFPGFWAMPPALNSFTPLAAAAAALSRALPGEPAAAPAQTAAGTCTTSFATQCLPPWTVHWRGGQ